MAIPKAVVQKIFQQPPAVLQRLDHQEAASAQGLDQPDAQQNHTTFNQRLLVQGLFPDHVSMSLLNRPITR